MNFKRILSVILAVVMMTASFASWAVIGTFTATAAAADYAPVALLGPDQLDNWSYGAAIAKSNVTNMGDYVRVKTNASAAEAYYGISGIYPLDVTGYPIIGVKYRADAGAFAGCCMEIFAGSGGGPTGGDSCTSGTIIADGEWHLATLNLATRGASFKDQYNLKYLRFDILNGSTTSGTAIDVAYMGFFADVQSAEDYFANPVDVHNFQSDIESQTAGTNLKNSDLAELFTISYGGEAQTVKSGFYGISSFTELYTKASGAYDFSVDIDNVSGAAGFNTIFVRGAIKATKETHYYGSDGNDTGGVSMGGAGIYLTITGGKARINIKSYSGGTYTPHIYTLPVSDAYYFTISDNGDQVVIKEAGNLVATIDISGTRDFGISGVAADQMAETVTITMADGTSETITDAIVASSAVSELGVATRTGTINITRLSLLPYGEFVYDPAASLPVYSTNAKQVASILSWDSVYKNTENNLVYSDGGAAAKMSAAPITLDPSWTSIWVRGWVGSGNKNNPIVKLGYKINGGNFVADEDAFKGAEQAVLNAGGDCRFAIQVSLTDYIYAEETYIQAYALLQDGTEMQMLNFWLKGHTTHTYDKQVVNETYFAGDATCTSGALYYFSCICGEKGTETFASGDPIAHTYDQEIVSDAHLASAATCTAPATYYYSCTCGANGTETFASGEALDHEWKYEYDANGHWQVCQREGCGETTEAVPHTGGTATATEQAICDDCGAHYGSLAGADENVNITYRGVQTTDMTAEGPYDIRFVATVDVLEYNKVGFVITEAAHGVNLTTESTTVYSGLNNAVGRTYTAEELGGTYIVAAVIKNIPTDAFPLTFTITPYVENTDGTIEYGEAWNVTITAEGVVSHAKAE